MSKNLIGVSHSKASDAMETILSRPAMGERLGQAGKAVATERFSTRRTAGQLWQLLQTVNGVS